MGIKFRYRYILPHLPHIGGRATASPSLRIAHEIKEELIAVYNSDITASGGMRQMKKRMQSR